MLWAYQLIHNNQDIFHEKVIPKIVRIDFDHYDIGIFQIPMKYRGKGKRKRYGMEWNKIK